MRPFARPRFDVLATNGGTDMAKARLVGKRVVNIQKSLDGTTGFDGPRDLLLPDVYSLLDRC